MLGLLLKINSFLVLCLSLYFYVLGLMPTFWWGCMKSATLSFSSCYYSRSLFLMSVDQYKVLEQHFTFLSEELQSSYPTAGFYIVLSASLQIFLFGLASLAFHKSNLLNLLISMEIMFLGLFLLFISFLFLKREFANYAVPLLLLAVVACESAIGLSIVVFTLKQGWQTDNFLFFRTQALSVFGGSGHYSKTVESKKDFFSTKNSERMPYYKFFTLYVFCTDSGTFFTSVSKYDAQIMMKNLDYIYLVAYLTASILLLVLLLVVASVFSLKSSTDQKLSSYECGFEPFGDSSGKQDTLFYVVAILFILFDIELVLMLPWVLSHNHLGVESLFLLLLFFGTLALGFAYEWSNGALKWIVD